MRAPEVCRGLGCVHAAEAWALAAILLDWMKPGILGRISNSLLLLDNPWCIAELMRPLPGWRSPSVDDPEMEHDFKIFMWPNILISWARA